VKAKILHHHNYYPNKQTRRLIFPFLLSQTILSATSTTNKCLYRDDVLPHANQRRILQEFASQNGLGHACFSPRPMQTKEGRNVIEFTLDAIQTKMKSSEVGSEQTKPHYVKHWSRQESRHIGEFYTYILLASNQKVSLLFILLSIVN
jgi:hypothetical protein